mmetsp:Transcript_43943/g.65179  ORF Transcript_43943/g.65179 Transcript_43943/m.65179 type:complete len:111 (+) Transcript_43943:255-587(+)
MKCLWTLLPVRLLLFVVPLAVPTFMQPACEPGFSKEVQHVPIVASRGKMEATRAVLLQTRRVTRILETYKGKKPNETSLHTASGMVALRIIVARNIGVGGDWCIAVGDAA